MKSNAIKFNGKRGRAFQCYETSWIFLESFDLHGSLLQELGL